MIIDGIIKTHKKGGKDKGRYLSLCCISINYYWNDNTGFECAHTIPLTQIFYMYEKLGECIYPFLNRVISYGNQVVLPGFNKNHGLTQSWLEIVFNKNMKPKEELDELLYEWGALKMANKHKLTKRMLNMTYKRKPKEGEKDKNYGLVFKKKGNKKKVVDFNPYWNARDIIAQATDEENEEETSYEQKNTIKKKINE